jgi:hypothetical protein
MAALSSELLYYEMTAHATPSIYKGYLKKVFPHSWNDPPLQHHNEYN